nr:PREDICTED: centrosome and spindle pole-associated protein 1 isoform X2 [Lepisosteus oculatus]XP_015209220.1 PREDICTED: centrosome and spindle pole-associated protein 1 isoform X2 [Lepisosteus oculatus]XP_015209221.1 PREDICTED: centrosome and spindle pole-associated protein 1 isoform X2 [Lepisosteus oculatus]XP_015209222.1 PREDICTED: centrosome and spindle pole-associated protein 1 isoform X2 [Lepisosteus oculatus]XP_015209223.1 PREDICTED: centrosome and spindle pole-associated protein 1 isof
MDDELEMFLEEQKAKVAREKASLEHDPPYMEIKTKADNVYNSAIKENIPPYKWSSPQKPQNEHGKDETYGLSLPLGEDYERKKHKLKQELRQDYRRYMAQELTRGRRKKKNNSSGETDVNAQGLSLPIGERRSAKDRLRSERNKEYNQFLRGQQEHSTLKREAKDLSQDEDRDVERAGAPMVPPELLPEVYLSPRAPVLREYPPPRRDAATFTEDLGAPMRGRRQGEGRSRRMEEEHEIRERRPRLIRLDPGSDEDFQHYLDSDEEPPELQARRRHRLREEPGIVEKRQRRVYYRPERDMPRLRDRRIDDCDDYPEMDHYVQRHRNENRVYREKRDKEAPIAYEEDYKERLNRKPLSAASKPKLQAPSPVKPSERSKSAAHKDEAEFATGLMIGAADADLALQKRKERYRQELQAQMAEQQRNKIREKELELRVAATGATDPEKQQDQEEPDRIKQFGAVSRDYDSKRRDVPYRPGQGLNGFSLDTSRRPREEKAPPDPEERAPPERPRVAFQSPILDYSAALGALSAGGGGVGAAGLQGSAAAPLSEDFHRGIPSTLGEIVAPRIASVPPPPPPTLTDTYRTPYDEAYYYYGARNPLDPSLAYYGPGALGVQPIPVVNPHSGVQLLNPQSHLGTGTQLTGQGKSTSGIGIFPVEKPRQPKDSMLSYQEALKQQIQEQQERKRREKEEKERYESKLEAEMKAYDPWGRGGGGAPLKDDRGNLITDLNRMHKSNEEAYTNPEARDKRAVVSVSRNVATPRDEARAPSAHRISGFSFAHTSPFARGNVFAEVPTPQQLHEQDKYKDYLKQQIEEKRRKQAEERERLRLEEEKEEKRLAEQRAKIQREYEEELERKKQKELEQKLKNEELVQQAEERRQEAERKKREAEEKERESLQREQYERERQARLEEVPRQPSPPIPALQKRMTSQQTPRPLSIDSRHSTAVSERSQSGARSPPVPARRNQLRAAEDQQGVISELSVLRKQLRSEQRRLEGQLLHLDHEDLDTPLSGRRRDKAQVDVFDMARLRMQAPVRRPSTRALEPMNIQNIREFNQLKYRDSESREEVRQAYPDPPSDDRGLEIQQQALLREQQRRINSLRRRGGTDDFEFSHAGHQKHHLRMDSAAKPLRGSLLESESAFIGTSGETVAVLPDTDQSTRQLSARERRRQHKKMDFDPDKGAPRELRDPAAEADAYSLASLNMDQLRDRNERRMRRLEDLSHQSWRTGEASADETDDILKQVSPTDRDRPYSVETVATEPWLRPGTSDTLKRFMAGQTRRERPPSANSLALNWEGPSTSHG